MADAVVVAILDRVIADFENRKQQQITEFLAMHAGSSLLSADDAEDDLEIRWTLFVIDEITKLRKKVIEGDTSR